MRVKDKLVLYVQCGKWIHRRNPGKNRETKEISGNVCRKGEGNFLALELEEKSSSRVRCEGAVTTRERCEWVKITECGVLLH